MRLGSNQLIIIVDFGTKSCKVDKNLRQVFVVAEQVD